MSILPADAGDDALVAALFGRVVVCAGCGEAEGELECEGCGEQLCPECWGGGDEVLCEGCLDEEAEPRPIEDVAVKEAYL